MIELAQIKIMPPELAGQIAAGEVVERPASVVKELVENSLDSGARQIDIEVSMQRRRIRVKDDGCGIAPGEMELALKRHGTSKIGSMDDICGISSYGFRGEALPSVAAVSRLTLTSHRSGEKTGRRIVVEGGKIMEATDAPAVAGTEVLVENLFYNTPARRKFVRSHATETARIMSCVIQSALSRPEVRFSFIKDKKRVLELPSAQTLLERVRRIFGEEYAEKLFEADFADYNIRVTGLIGSPDFSRATTMDQYFFVNSRPVKDPVLRSAVAGAFNDLLPRGRKPVLFLNLSLPPESVDVNVHPAKEEVRFANTGEIRSVVMAAIRKSLGKNAMPHGDMARSAAQPGATFAGVSIEAEPMQKPSPLSAPGGGKASFAGGFELWKPLFMPDDRPVSGTPGIGQLELKPTHGKLSRSSIAVGQLFNTFLVFEDGEQVLIMDQHTVHERTLFERIMTKLKKSAVERQALLIPETFKTDPKSSEILVAHIKTFADFGWGIEEFGENSFVIREVPAMLVGRGYHGIVEDMLSSIAANRDAEFTEMLSTIAARMACKAAVKAGDRLSLKEITMLSEELAEAELPYTCPHGRPVALAISKEKLCRDFGRTLPKQAVK